MGPIGEPRLEQENHGGKTRRTLLKSGVLGALAFPLAFSLRTTAIAAPAISGDETGESFRTFTEPHHQKILRAILREEMVDVLPDILQAPGTANELALNKMLLGCDGYMAHMPMPVQDEAREGLDLLDIAPVRWLLGGPWGDWGAAGSQEIRAFMEGLRTSRFALKRTLYQFLHDMGHVGWFGERASWEAVGYPGPPLVPRPQGEGRL